MHPINRLEQTRDTPAQPTGNFFSKPARENSITSVIQDARWSRVSAIDETLPESEHPERRHRWYRPWLVG